MKLLKIAGIGIGIIYLLACVILYLAQDKFIFDPRKLPEDYQFRAGSEIKVKIDDKISLSCLLIPSSAEQSKGVIMYLHGNRGSNRRCTRQAGMFEGNGYDIFMPDYRGFGKSDGSISSENQLFQDVQQAYDHLKQSYQESDIIIIGYSLGTAMASYLAAHNNPQRLILVAPYLSFIDLKDRRVPLIPDFLVKYPLENEALLSHVNCPVTLFHGTNDEIIPFDSSEKLAQIDPQNFELVPLPETGHRRSIFHSQLRTRISELLR